MKTNYWLICLDEHGEETMAVPVTEEQAGRLTLEAVAAGKLKGPRRRGKADTSGLNEPLIW